MTQTSRHRERELQVEVVGSLNKSTNLNPSPVHHSTPKVAYDREVMDDIVTDHYRERIAAGEIINNPCNYSRFTHKLSGSVYWLRDDDVNPGYWHLFEGDGLTQLWLAGNEQNLFDAEPAELKLFTEDDSKLLEAKAKAINNIDRADYNFGEDVGEIRETFRFIRSPLASMVNVATAFRRDVFRRTAVRSKKKGYHANTPQGERERALNFSRDIAAAWAEYFWALQPLIRSIEDALTILGDIATGLDLDKQLPPRISSRGFSEDEVSEQLDIQFSVSPLDRICHWQKYIEVEHHASILYSLTDPVRDWRKLLGLRFKDLPFTIWQVLPLSFMVDRVVDISGVIRGVTNLADPNVTILAASVRTKRTTELRAQFTRCEQANYTTTFTADEVSDTKFAYDRVLWYPNVSDLIPKIEISGLVDDAFKIIDLAAVVLSRLRF